MKLVVILRLVVLMLVLIFPDLWLESVGLIYPNNFYSVNRFGYIYLILYDIFFICWSFYNLLAKYRDSDGISRVQLKNLILGAAGVALFGIIFETILPLVGNYQYYWLGPYLALVLLFYLVQFFIFKK